MTREEAIETIKTAIAEVEWEYPMNYAAAFDVAIEALEQKFCEDMGEVSDGYHTFNQLYHQRAVLFATIVNQNKDKAWKSFRHSDGNYCFDSNGEWFIVGINTPKGSYTYHYSKEYWDMFDCEELECGKEWDGHTEEDVTRLLSLEQEPCEMTAEEYRQRMIQAFHNADCDELIALVVLPTEKEFEYLEWLLEKHYKAKPEPCTDAISRQAAIDCLNADFTIDGKENMETVVDYINGAFKQIKALPSVTPQPKMGQWIEKYAEDACGERYSYWACSECGRDVGFNLANIEDVLSDYPYCHCGAKMVEPQESEDKE